MRPAAMGEDGRTAAGGTSNTLNNESRRDGDNKCARGSSAHFIRGSRSGREAAACHSRHMSTEIDRNSSPHTALRGARPASQFTFTPYVLACGYMCACIVPLSQYSVGNTWHVDEFYVSCPLRQTNRLYHVKDMGFGRSRTPKVKVWLSRGAEYE